MEIEIERNLPRGGTVHLRATVNGRQRSFRAMRREIVKLTGLDRRTAGQVIWGCFDPCDDCLYVGTGLCPCFGS